MTAQRILIVDDDEDLCDLFEVSLASANYEVSCCMYADQAIAQCETFNPDLILMDLSLPGTPGDKLFRQIREKGIQTPIAFLTAETSQTKKQSLLQAGAIDVLIKPIKPYGLIKAVERLLSS